MSGRSKVRDRLNRAAPELLGALRENRTDLVVLRGSVADAEKRDPHWEGMTEKVQEWIDRADAAIRKATEGE